MENFLFAFRANFPILLSILCGAVFAAIVNWDIIYYRKLNVIIFRFLFPLQLFFNVYTVEKLSEINWKILFFLVIAAFICLVVGMITAHFAISKKDQKCVIIQAAFRTNIAVIGSSLVSAICTVDPAKTMALTSITVCASAILYNIMAVIVLGYNKSERVHFQNIFKGIVTNPLVIGSVVGLLFVLGRELVFKNSQFRAENAFPSLFQVISSFSKAASPMALFCLGAMLDFKAVKSLLREIVIGVSLRLVICPIIIILLAFLFKKQLSLSAVEVPVIIAIAASPISVSSAIMVQEMGGDHQLANHLVVWSSVFSVITLFFFTFFMRSIGWI